MKKVSITTAALIIGMGFHGLANSEPSVATRVKWTVYLEGLRDGCTLTAITPNVTPKNGRQTAEGKEYALDPSEFTLSMRKEAGMLGIFGKKSEFIPVTKISKISYKDTYSGRRRYEAITDDGSKIESTDNFGVFFACKNNSDKHWSERCLEAYGLYGECTYSSGATQLAYLWFDPNGNGAPPLYQSRLLKEIVALDEATMNSKQDSSRHEAYINAYKRANDRDSLKIFVKKYREINFDPDNLITPALKKIDYFDSVEADYKMIESGTAPLESYINKYLPKEPSKYCLNYDKKSQEYIECLDMASSVVTNLAKTRAIFVRKFEICTKVEVMNNSTAGTSCNILYSGKNVSCKEAFGKLNNSERICDTLSWGKL